MYSFGSKGEGRAELNFARGITTDTEGDILVADTGNHRIQRYTSTGIYKTEFGSKGTFRGEFLNPNDVTIMENDDVVVADTGNCRIQIFRPHGRLKHYFSTNEKPVFIACDTSFNIIVSTSNRTIEVYDVSRDLVSEFSLGAPAEGSPCALPVAVNGAGEIIVCDVSCNIVRAYSLEGEVLSQFRIVAAGEGLHLKVAGIALNPIGQLIVIDSLNHTANLYSDGGVLLQRLLAPSDDLGAAHSCAVGPEGHLIVAEYSLTGPQTVKVFRYGDCECHRSRGGTSKRNTPVPPKSPQ